MEGVLGHITPISLLCVLYGVVCGLCLPKITRWAVAYKCRQYDRVVPNILPDAWMKVALVAVHIVLCSIAAVGIAFPQALFVCLFVSFALVGTLIDHSLRIIPNELLLMLLAVGIVYRVVDGGFQSLSGSLIAFGCVMAVFVGAAFLMKLIKGQRGVGAGDIKLAAVIAVIAGVPGVIYFALGSSLAILVYCIVKMNMGTLGFSLYFPMCAHLMIGLLCACFLSSPSVYNVLLKG